jgi:hypothetical protein
VHGWCYIDRSGDKPIGSAELVSSCPPTKPRAIRFVGGGRGVGGSKLFLACDRSCSP